MFWVQIVYLTVGKEAYQMEVPDRFLPKVPREFEVRSSRKVSHIHVLLMSWFSKYRSCEWLM
jgi:hypothetical protein